MTDLSFRIFDNAATPAGSDDAGPDLSRTLAEMFASWHLADGSGSGDAGEELRPGTPEALVSFSTLSPYSSPFAVFMDRKQFPLATPDPDSFTSASLTTSEPLTIQQAEPVMTTATTLAVTTLAVTDISLFDPSTPVTGATYNDRTAVELGLRFVAAEDGQITALKYWRSATDATDTDTREGHLWDANGNLLDTVTFTSVPGQTGWQVAVLDTPVQITANTEYVVSYKTLDNYVATGNFFAAPWTDLSGTLTAPGGRNGVYAYSTTLLFPSLSYNATNYWVDVSFAPASLPLAAPDSAVVLEDATVLIDVLANDTDPAGGTLDPTSVRLEAADDASGTVRTVAGQGTWSVDPATGAITFAPAPNYDGTVTPISYTVANATGQRSAPATVEVTITPVNDAPVAAPDAATVPAGGSVLIDVLNNDSDIEDGKPDPTTVRIVDADDATGRIKTVAGEGTWTVNLTTGAITFAPAAGYAGPVTPIAYSVADSGGLRSDPAIVSVTIIPPNDPPIAGNDSATTLEDTPLTIDVLANDTDAEDGTPDPTSVRISDADDPTGTVKTVAGEGTWTVDPVTGAITFAPALNYAGPVTPIAYSVADSLGLRSATATVSVTITPVNDPPVAAAQNASTVQGTPVTIPVTTLLAGATDPDGDTLTVTSVSGAINGTVLLNDQGDTDPANDTVTFTPTAGFTGKAFFDYTISDGQGGADSAKVTVAVASAGTNTTILEENQKPGVPKAIWDAAISNQIEGFATDISVDTGDAISFKINVNARVGELVPYHIEIYRLGYYGGDGATLVTTIDNLIGTAQPDPITDSRGLVDAGNWSVSATWQTPEDAVSGVYIARLVRDDTGAENQLPFILREDDLRADGTRSDIVFQTSDTTWQAYNGWAGNNGQVGGNFYGGFNQPDDLTSDPGLNPDRSFAVSYNRPFLTRDGGGAASGAQDYLFGADFAAIYWLEKNGYDVTYISGVDTDRLGPNALLGHKAYISAGHDEYWSGDQRLNVEAARDAGVHLLFWSGNEVYWKTRYEPSIDGSNTDYRTLVSYKETWANFSLDAGPADYANIDPSNEWTGTWRDLRFVDAVDANGTHIAVGARPENSLTGQFFGPDGTGEFGGALDVPQEYADSRYWRDTAAEGTGVTGLAAGILGYEWDTSPEDAYRPAGLIKLSSTTLDWSGILIDEGNRTAPGTATHNLTIYRAESGAMVFGAGTVFWSWGLSDQHDNSPYAANIANTTVQQFSVNLFADMGIQPAVTDAFLASEGLVRASASTDFVAATTTMNDLPASVTAMTPITLTGIATDDDNNPSTTDGVVGVVEVSFDGGATWNVASGRGTWSYTWVPQAPGTYEVLARAIDDSLNLPSTTNLARDIVEVTGPQQPTAYSLFDPYTTVTGASYNDRTAVELGLRFQATQAGEITELKYWRAAGDATDTDTRAGHLWDANGNLLATVTFTSLPGQTGWQVAALDTPVQVSASTVYVVSYKTLDNYVATGGYFGSSYTDPFSMLTAPAGQNGVYAYNSNLQFPANSYNSTNYWVDVSFEPGTATVQVAGTLTPAGGFNPPATSTPESGPTGIWSLLGLDRDMFHFAGSDRPDNVAPTFGAASFADLLRIAIGERQLPGPFDERPGFAGLDHDTLFAWSDGVSQDAQDLADASVPPVFDLHAMMDWDGFIF